MLARRSFQVVLVSPDRPVGYTDWFRPDKSIGYSGDFAVTTKF
jgi:hypothetical protein